MSLDNLHNLFHVATSSPVSFQEPVLVRIVDDFRHNTAELFTVPYERCASIMKCCGQVTISVHALTWVKKGLSERQ